MELTDKCPYCEQPITRQKYEAILARIRREEQERIRSLEAAARKQLDEKYRHELEALRQALKKQQDEAILKREAHFAREREAYQRKIQDLQRQIEKKTAHELGDGAELDLFEVLHTAFPEDAIQRVPKGETGADVIQEVRYRGEVCGTIIYDSKNRRAWRSDFVAKLKEDKAQIGAAHAVLASVSFPRGEQELCVEDGVIVVHPKRAIYIAHVLRSSMITLHRQGLSLKERTGKMAELYRYLSSGDFTQRVREAEELVDKLRELDSQERDSHEKNWKLRERLLIRMKTALGDIDNRVTAIMEKKDSGGVAAAAS